MGYDLAFWADLRDDRPDPRDVYVNLIDDLPVSGLSNFETESVLAALRDRLPGLDLDRAEETGSAFWQSPDYDVAFEFSWSPQHLLVTARGRYTNDQINAIIDVGIEVGKGRLYDPQTNERFDSF